MFRARIPPPLLALIAGALMWWIDRHWPLLRLVGRPWNQAGWGLIGIGFVLDVLAMTAFVRARTTPNPVRVDRATTLVVTGLYRISRNPMYLGLLAILAGWALLLGSLSPFLLILVFERLMVICQIRVEEAALTARFGAEYAAYTRSVRRWLGRTWRSPRELDPERRS